MSFTQVHKGITIELDAIGQFCAVVGGVRVRKPSLPAMRKHIDEAAKVIFKPFTAIADVRHGDKPLKGAANYTRVKVVGVKKNEQRYARSAQAFITVRTLREGTATPTEEYAILYEDTPENLALLLAEDAKKAEKARVDRQFEKEIEQIVIKQKRINADKFARKVKSS